jgi:hypothetical protein
VQKGSVHPQIHLSAQASLKNGSWRQLCGRCGIVITLRDAKAYGKAYAKANAKAYAKANAMTYRKTYAKVYGKWNAKGYLKAISSGVCKATLRYSTPFCNIRVGL